MSMPPVRIATWRRRFIPALTRFLLRPGAPSLKDVVVVFPHNRPARYLRSWLSEAPEAPRPCFLPRLYSFQGLTAHLADGLRPEPARTAGRLDQAGLLLDIVQGLQAGGSGLLALLPGQAEPFLPWGFRLAGLIEELLRQDVAPANLVHLEGEVTDWAAALLEQMGTIAEQYIAALEERGLTTPGLDARLVCGDLDAALDSLGDAFGDAPVVSAGFYGLSGAEKAVFTRLRHRGQLEVLWHADPALALGGPSHPCEAEHRAWLKEWGATAELLEPVDHEDSGPDVAFIEGFDLHSQLAGLEQELARAESFEDTAVVLPETSALIPVLHHLPVADVNVSMGYPLTRTGLYQLVEIVLGLQEHAALDQGRTLYRWRDLVALLRHPWVRLLASDPENGDAPTLRPLLRAWEQAVRAGLKFQDPEAWRPVFGAAPLEEIDPDRGEELMADLVRTFLRNFEGLSTLGGLAKALADMADLLIRRGREHWNHYLIDAEYLARLRTSLIPELLASRLRDRVFRPSTLFSILRQLCRAERVSFEPDPLTGLQVLGMLETRLLAFKTLYVLDATEDKLPGAGSPDPLLPDPLRHLAGLPDARQRDHVAAYNFTRLLMGAERAVLLYQAGVTPGLFDSKSMRSRFVEQLLWEQEKKRGRIIRPGEEPLRTMRFPARPVPTGDLPVPKTEALALAVRDWLGSGRTPVTGLDAYLRCPKRFYFTRLAGLKPLRGVSEEGDPAEFGQAVHAALQRFYEPRTGQDLDPGDLDPDLLTALFEEELDKTDFFRQTPYDVRQSLLAAGRHRLALYLENQGPTRVVELETALRAEVEVEGVRVTLTGQMDRVDERTLGQSAGRVILDYKTGSLPRFAKGFWEDTDLHDRLEAWTPESDPGQDRDLLEETARASGGVQLPAYLWMDAQGRDRAPLDAGWVELADKGREVLLLGPKRTEAERREAVLETAPLLVRFVIRHMLACPDFPGIDGRGGRGCQWCEARNLCAR